MIQSKQKLLSTSFSFASAFLQKIYGIFLEYKPFNHSRKFRRDPELSTPKKGE